MKNEKLAYNLGPSQKRITEGAFAEVLVAQWAKATAAIDAQAFRR